MLDMSAELSSKREEKIGKEDSTKRQFYDDYKTRVGKKHMSDRPKRVETSAAIAEW